LTTQSQKNITAEVSEDLCG